MKTQEEIEREINERAKGIMNNDSDKSYDAYVKQKSQRLQQENIQNTAGTTQTEKEGVQPQSDYKAQYTQQATHSQEVQQYVAYGGFWRRLAASFLDYLPTFIVFMVVFIGVLLIITGEVVNSGVYINALAPAVSVSMLINMLYNIILYYREGMTLGYKILGMQIISEETGVKPDNWVLFGRWLIKTVLISIPYLNIIGYALILGMISWTKNKQGPHDKIMKTVVVMKERERVWLVWVSNLIPIVVVGIVVFFASFTGGFGNFINSIDPQLQKERAYESVVKSDLSHLSMQGLLYYSDQGDYDGFCASGRVSQSYTCVDSERGFMAFAPLGEEEYYCIDSEGNEGEYAFVDETKISCK